MVIADAESPGPVKKRQRLSLKFLKSTGHKDGKSATPKKEKQETSDIKDCSEAKTVQELAMSEDSLGSYDGDDGLVPAVSSLENLGNTCFLNSILQVLRFTPGFLSGLEDLHKEMILVDKLKRQDASCKEEEPHQMSLTWDLVKDLYKLYKGMERREDRHPEVASSDVMSMALKPDKILTVIRELNPMFEGHLQHDAQELLRCILCYLQDASKEIKKMKNTLPPCMLPSQSKGPINPIMQKFLLSKSEKKLDIREKRGSPTMQQPSCSPTKTMKTEPDGVDFLDQIEKCEAAKTAAIERSETPLEADVPTCDTKRTLRKQDVGCHRAQTHCCTEIDEVDGCVDKNRKSRPGKRKSQSDDVSETDNCSEAQTEENNKDSAIRRSKRSRKLTMKANVKSQDSTVRQEILSQPSIATMFSLQGSNKRLGMSGAMVRKNVNSGCETLTNGVEGKEVNTSIISNESNLAMNGIACEKLQEKPSNSCQNKSINNVSPRKGINGNLSPRKKTIVETKLQEKCLSAKVNGCLEEVIVKSPSKLTSEFQKMNCQNSLSPKTKHPLIKLEKCDHICNSPKKFVSADFAERTLSPFKVQTPVSKQKLERIGSARHKLDFLDDLEQSCVRRVQTPNKRCKVIQTPPRKSRTDFVENLFMGSMMLRTRCLECEFSRERIEEFHDISVPVKKEKYDDDDEEDDMDCDLEQNSCLAKLMEAFTEVERLRDENKYFCDKCNRHVEAERSLHYEVLPDILTLHLKRFSATSGLYGYVSKINDHVTIPLSLPCLRYKCPSPCSRPDHRYRLFALVTHAGMTLTSGHYLSYVRVMEGEKAIYGDSPCGASLTASSISSRLASASNHISSTPRSKLNLKHTTPQKSGELKNTDFLCVPRQKYQQKWLECDDETIRTYSEERFHNMLKGVDGSLMGTPYVLFYHRVLPW